uniref:Uncharacterized protein n=1 Tax=Solanum lycopersicum TaxID=4081 RepID=K4CME1_SOLLC
MEEGDGTLGTNVKELNIASEISSPDHDSTLRNVHKVFVVTQVIKKPEGSGVLPFYLFNCDTKEGHDQRSVGLADVAMSHPRRVHNGPVNSAANMRICPGSSLCLNCLLKPLTFQEATIIEFSAAKILANLIVMGSSILARAFVQAYRQALSNASKNGVAQEAVQNIKAASKTMTEAEARQILGVTEDSSWKKIVQNYESLFERNAKNESFYLQSNVLLQT